jgi:CBS domain containing-hemolysin-like protein
MLIVIFGEIMPKSAAMLHTEETLAFCAPPLRVLGFLAYPVTRLVQECVRLLGWALRIDMNRRSPFVTREEIEQLVNIGVQSGALEASERRMIHGVIDLEETRVHDVMAPRADIVMLDASDTVASAVQVFIDCGHSRLPVCSDTPDDIVGMLHVKDTLKCLSSGDLDRPVGELARPPMFVPENIRTVELLETMRREHTHIAVAVDEYGSVSGVVTMEDLLEEIVGEIQDEYDMETPGIQEEAGTFLVQGNVALDELGEVLGDGFECDDAESIGGLVLSLAGKFPEAGAEFSLSRNADWLIKVVEVEEHRVKLVRMTRKKPAPGVVSPAG